MKADLRRWAVLSGLLATAWAITPSAVPLYDGVGFPDEPYRYVSPPSGAKHGPAPKAEVAVNSHVAGGMNSSRLDVASDEQGPQVLVAIPAGGVRVAAAGINVIARVMPLAADAQPADGRVDGNVYRVELLAEPPTAVTLGAGSGPALIYLRAASLNPAPPEMEYRSSPQSSWLPLPTRRSGQDVFVTAFKGPGDYALVHKRGAKPPPRTVSQETVVLLLLAIFVTTIITLMILSRRRMHHEAEIETEKDES